MNEVKRTQADPALHRQPAHQPLDYCHYIRTSGTVGPRAVSSGLLLVK